MPAQACQHPFEDGHEAHAAGIHDAGLFQHGILMDGVRQGGLGGGDGIVHNVLNGVVLLGLPGAGLGGDAGDGQNCALGRLHDGLVGHPHAVAQRFGETGSVQLLLALEGFGEAAKEEGENDPGVAACAAEQCRGGGVGCLGEAGGVELAEVARCGAHGHAHIGPGIAVRNGKHVELIDLLLLNLY